MLKHLVSLWSLAAFADGKISKIEEKVAKSMLSQIIDDDEFPPNLVNREAVFDEIYSMMSAPFSFDQVTSFIASCEGEFSVACYAQACTIVGADMRLGPSERRFLNRLGKGLELKPEQCKLVESVELSGVTREGFMEWLFRVK